MWEEVTGLARTWRYLGKSGNGGKAKVQDLRSVLSPQAGCYRLSLPNDNKPQSQEVSPITQTLCPSQAMLEFATKFLKRVSLTLEGEPECV